MMQALIAGGLEPIYSKVRERVMDDKRKWANPRGWYELKVEQMMDTQFLYEAVNGDGRCMKMPIMYLRNLPPKPTRVVWMHRDPAEIIASFVKAFPQEDVDKRFGKWPDTYHYTTRAMRELMADRRSVVEIVDINYADFVSSPELQLETIAGIDVARASLAVDKSLYRIREVN